MKSLHIFLITIALLTILMVFGELINEIALFALFNIIIITGAILTGYAIKKGR